MNSEQTLRNKNGELWNVEHNEHAGLTHIDGFLMTFGAQSCIALRQGLDAEAKVQARAQMLQILADMPLGTSRTIFWPLAEA